MNKDWIDVMVDWNEERGKGKPEFLFEPLKEEVIERGQFECSVWREKLHTKAKLSQAGKNILGFMDREVVHKKNITWLDIWDKDLFDIIKHDYLIDPFDPFLHNLKKIKWENK